MGLGYVGLPLAVAMVEAGLEVFGYDVSVEKVALLSSRRSPVEDVTDGRLGDALDAGLEVSADPAGIADVDAVFICVPSPLGRNRQPDLSHIEEAAALVSGLARPGCLVALESTTYPGTTEEVVAGAMHEAGLEIDRDVWVAFSPERVSPGGSLATAAIPKIVGGVTADSTDVAVAAYRRFVSSVHPVSSSRVAEMAKLLENTYRAVNIGLINEMAQLTNEIDIDIWEVIEAAATKPFGFQPFYPGPGVGGHCIPLDPQYLAWRAREANFATRFIDVAEQVNSRMPAYTAGRIAEILNDRGQPVSGTRILGVGIAYKPDVADDRESASVAVLRILAGRGADVSVLDPLISDERIEERSFTPIGPDDDFGGFAIAVILTDHSELDLERLAKEVPVVFDARGAYRRAGIAAANVVSL